MRKGFFESPVHIAQYRSSGIYGSWGFELTVLIFTQIQTGIQELIQGHGGHRDQVGEKCPRFLTKCPLYFSGSYFLMINPSTFFNWGARRPPTPPPCIFLCLGSVHYLPTPNFFFWKNGSTLLKKNADKMVMDDPWSPYSPCTGENDPVGVKLFFWLRAIPTKEYGGGRQEWNCPNKNWNKVNYLVLNIFNPQRSVIPFVIF